MTTIGFRTITVCQGELAVSGEPGVSLSAILGSCVATCLWDPRAKVGGMNHILLPGRADQGPTGNKYGIFAMEALINDLMKAGARKGALRARIFGGAQTFENGLGIGAANAEFVRGFLETEGIPIVSASVGGTQSRRIRFTPSDGRVEERLTQLAAADPDEPTVSRVRRRTLSDGGSGTVELF